MSFDAFMTSAVTNELSKELTGARVEKVLQPSKDEIFLLLHRESSHYRLQMNASPASPRIGLTREAPENPQTPPTFCMLLRKHLTGAKITSVTQLAFERAIKVTFETYDEMGFFSARHLICEIMGRYSNIILCEDDSKETDTEDGSERQMRVIACARPVDLTTSRKRQLLHGMIYESPPAQEKADPFTVTKEELLLSAKEYESRFDKLFTEKYLGFSPLLSRELAHRAQGSAAELWNAFSSVISDAENKKFVPVLISDEKGSPIEFSCFPVTCYGKSATVTELSSFGELTDRFFAERERAAREKSRAAETAKLLSNLEKRIEKKLKLQAAELKEAEKGEEYKKSADLITANIYLLKRGEKDVTLTDYSDCREDGSYGEIKVTLDPRLTPSQNAQKLYKKYAKTKTAKEQLTVRIAAGEQELIYIRSVSDALSRINGQSDLEEIRAELTEAGYIRAPQIRDNAKKGSKSKKQNAPRPPKRYTTESGMTVLVGRNNLENDRLTFKIAEKTDIWLHVKNVPGSHTVLILDGKTATDRDIEEAAAIAAANSSASDDDKVTVDYTPIKNVKKPSGAKPGFVIYNTYKQIVVRSAK